jgi:hypothetical protein
LFLVAGLSSVLLIGRNASGTWPFEKFRGGIKVRIQLLFYVALTASLGLFCIQENRANAGTVPSQSPVNALGRVQCDGQTTEPGARLAPTGCTAPNAECFKTSGALNPAATCRSAAANRACSNFTWEKCCFVTCNQKNPSGALKFASRNECMDICMSNPGARVFVPRKAR